MALAARNRQSAFTASYRAARVMERCSIAFFNNLLDAYAASSERGADAFPVSFQVPLASVRSLRRAGKERLGRAIGSSWLNFGAQHAHLTPMNKITVYVVALAASLTILLSAQQQSARDDIKDAGKELKKAGKVTGKAAQKTRSAAKKTTKKAVHKSAEAVGDAAETVKERVR